MAACRKFKRGSSEAPGLDGGHLDVKSATRRDGQTDYPWVVGQRRGMISFPTPKRTTKQ